MARPGSHHVAEWQAYNDTPWGRLRLDLIWANLERRVPFPPGRVLDVGCGLGETAVRFASAGSEVVAVDASPAMVAETEARASDTGVALTCARIEVEHVGTELAGEAFDLVLCHDVLGYVSDPAAACSALAGLLGDDARVSITAANRMAEPLRAALVRHDLRAARDAVETGGYVRTSETFGTELVQTDFDDVGRWLETAGLHVDAMLGIRVVNDYLVGADELKTSPEGYRDLLLLELELCERDPYRQIAQILHVIGRRPAR